MPITNPAQVETFNATYDRLGSFVTDDSRVPYFNPSDSALLIQPGEPLVIKKGASGEERVYFADDPIRPGEAKNVCKHFTVDLPCDFSANVIDGDEVMWDVDNNVVSLAADVTNGFIVGDASYVLSEEPDGLTKYAVDANDRVIAATSSSTVVRVVSRDEAATTKGTVTIL